MVGRKSREHSIDSAIRMAGGDGIPPDTRIRLEKYLDEVAIWSERIHLVGKSRMPRNLDLLVLDSLLLWRAAEEGAPHCVRGRPCRVADIGSGAGFPGLVWKIVTPRLEMTLFERKMKAQLFLDRMISLLELEGVRVIGEDASAFKEKGSFDVAVSKASGRLNSILPLAEKLLIPGGAYLTIKGRAWESEIAELRKSSMHLVSAKELAEKRGYALVFRKEPRPTKGGAATA